MAIVAVVDDDPNMRDVLTSVLEYHGHQAVQAGDGREGLKVIRETRPDLVLLDMRMPVMDGSEVLAAMRGEEALRSIPVIFLTGEMDPQLEVDSLEGGANDYINKPFHAPELLARIDVQLRMIKLEREIQASEARYRTLFERSTDPMMLLDENGRILQVNEAAGILFGVGSRQLLESQILDCVSPSGRPEFEAALIGAMEGSQIPIFECHLIPLQGWELPVDVDLHPIEIQGRRHLLLHTRDIRWRRATHEWSKRIFEHIGDAVFIADARGLILMGSRSAGELSGYSRTELVGRDIAQLHPPETTARWQEAFLPGLRGREPLTYEGLLRKKDGTMIFVEWTLSMFTVENEAYLIGVARDLTERKRLEAELREAMKMEAVGQLAGGIAHEFNNLLQVIMGYSELLKGALKPGDGMGSQLEEIRNAGGRAASLTRQLLAFSRRQMLQPEVVDLNEILQGLEKVLRQAVRHRVTLALSTDPGLGRVRVDPAQIQQAVMELALNARDAMPAGGELTVETVNVELGPADLRDTPDLKPGPYVCVTVADTGTGIDAETLEHLFEPFFTTKKQGEGKGLGLATVYGLVRQSGGALSVSSDPGKGSTFRICLPQIEEVPALHGMTAKSPSMASGTETILLVEDEEMVRRLVARVLKLAGYAVLEAAGGPEALDLSRRREGGIDLLVTDLVMPAMNGREVAEAVKRQRPDLKVLYISGYARDTMIRQGDLDPGSAFLQKPFTPDAITRRVREMLDEKGDLP